MVLDAILQFFLYVFIGLPLILFIAFLFKRKQIAPNGKKSVAFVHLDLGVGGAERLVVDAAIGLKSKGNSVKIYTTNHPRDHCFPETLTEIQVKVRGNFIPHHISGSLQAILSLIRMNYLAFCLTFFEPKYDVIIADGISGCIPLLKLSGSKILFYCHFPDQLLTRKKSLIRAIYRFPLDVFEDFTTGMAHKVVVNSLFTKDIFKKTFKNSADPQVVYPSLNTKRFDQLLQNSDTLPLKPNRRVIFSINRFDPSKNIELAIEAFHLICQKDPDRKQNLQLILAGGYETKVRANVVYLQKLQDLAQSRGLESQTLFLKKIAKNWNSLQLKEWPNVPIVFLPDIWEEQKVELLRRSLVLLYTPSNEHFGIVPVETMFCRCPVIAVNNGGPLESVGTDEIAGFLAPSNPEDFANRLERIVVDTNKAKKMGEQGRARAISKFSFEKFSEDLDSIVAQLA